MLAGADRWRLLSLTTATQRQWHMTRRLQLSGHEYIGVWLATGAGSPHSRSWSTEKNVLETTGVPGIIKYISVAAVWQAGLQMLCMSRSRR